MSVHRFCVSILARAVKLTPICLLALTACAVEVGPPGPYPDHVYTQLRTELVFDGRRITVEETSRCTRSDNYNSHGKLVFFLDSTGPLYRCGPKWFGKRLADGSALLVGAYSVAGKWGVAPNSGPPDLTKRRERVAKVPRAVIWLDNAENPTRGEYYYSAIALEDPRSRLTEIGSEIVGVHKDYVSVSDPADEVPWVSKRHSGLNAEYAIFWPKVLWSKIPGLKHKLDKYDEPVFLLLSKGLSLEHSRALSQYYGGGRERVHPYLWPSPRLFSFGLGFRRFSSHYFERSRYLQPMERFAGLLRPVRSLPLGVILLKPNQRNTIKIPYVKRSIKIQVDQKTLSYNEHLLRIQVFLYDPKTERIYRFLNTFFNTGPLSFVYGARPS